MLLLTVLLLMQCCTATADEIEPKRPNRQYEFPVAVEINHGGVVHKCFAKDGEDWKTVGHIIVDYRLFFHWSTWAESRMLQLDTIQRQSAMWQHLAQSNERSFRFMEQVYTEEHKLRIGIERDKRILPWALGLGLLLETVAITGLSIWGAAK
jgi:hypothetical protein